MSYDLSIYKILATAISLNYFNFVSEKSCLIQLQQLRCPQLPLKSGEMQNSSKFDPGELV